MSTPLFLAGQKVLLTRQRHDAKRAGLHYDYRIVVGDKAYSWATKKELPDPGKSILLFEQPVHDSAYALSKKVVIPDGEYGAGVTTLDFVRKAQVAEGAKDNHFSLHFDGQKLTFWKIPPGANFYQKKMGAKAKDVWMLWNRSDYKEGPESTYTHNGKIATVDSLISAAKKVPTVSMPISEMKWALKDAKINPDRLSKADLKHPVIATLHDGRITVLDGTHRLAKAVKEGRSELGVKLVPDPSPVEKKASDDLHEKFSPDLTPEQMEALGVLVHKGSQYKDGSPKENFFRVRASMDAWPDSWHNPEHPMGWYQWYQGYSKGKRTADDERQVKRWLSFKARHLAQLKKADPTLADLSIQPRRRQALLNWGIAPGINLEKAMTNKYLEKLAKISIDPAHKGLLHEELGIPAGEKIPAGKLSEAKAEAKASGNVAEEKRIVFAQNAKKWTKSASMVKQAWDSDFTDGEYYGVSANRSTKSPMVIESLRKAAKDPKVRVQIWGDFPGGKQSYSSKDDPEGFEKGLSYIESKVPKKTAQQHDKDNTMQWHRDFSWEAGIHSKEALPKSEWEDEYDPSDTAGIHQSRVLSYLGRKHGL